AVRITDDLCTKILARLFKEENRYQSLDAAGSLFNSVRKTHAREHIEQAKAGETNGLLINIDLDPYGQLKAEQLATAAEARAKAKAELLPLAADHPLLEHEKFPYEDLALAESPAEVQSVLLGFIKDQREKVVDIREELQDDHDLVYKLDVPLNVTKQFQDVTRGSISDGILQDHSSQLVDHENRVQRVRQAFALAFGLLSLGSGTIAIAGGVGAAVLAGHRFGEELQEFELQSSAFDVELKSVKPS